MSHNNGQPVHPPLHRSRWQQDTDCAVSAPTSNELFCGADEKFALRPPSWQRYEPVPVAVVRRVEEQEQK